MPKNREWLWNLPVVAVWATILLVYGGFVEDDAFISFRYARNLATGQGFTFNAGEPHFGTSAPLFALVVAILGIPNPSWIPAIGFALSAVSLLACGLAVSAFFWDSRRDVGVLGGLLVVASPLTFNSFGMEMSTQAALVLWGLHFCRIGHPFRGHALLTLAVLVRPDAIVALLLGLLYTAVKRRSVPWREATLSGGVLVLAAVAFYAYFGSALPATATAKQAQVESGIWRSFIPGALHFLNDHYVLGRHLPIAPIPAETIDTPLPGWQVWVALTAVGTGFCRRALLPVLWAVGMSVAYQLGKVTFNDWYIFPVGVGISILAACSLLGLPRAAVHACSVVSAVFLVWYAAERGSNCMDGRTRSYVQVGKWLGAHTPPQSTVGFIELGYVGWHSERKMVDPLGLVHSGVDSHVAARDFGYMYRKRNPDYVVDCSAFNVLFKPSHTLDWLHSNYMPVREFKNRGYAPVSIWKRKEAPLGERSPSRPSNPQPSLFVR